MHDDCQEEHGSHQAAQTHQGSRRKVAADKKLTTETSASAENELAHATEMPANPAVITQAAGSATDAMVESSRIVAPMPAKETTTATASSSPKAAASVNALSALDAAAKESGEGGQAMTYRELIAAMAAKGYWRSPRGRTPAGTLYSAVLRELHSKGEQSLFVKTERGKFALRGAV